MARKSPSPIYIWQRPRWPRLTFNAQVLTADLQTARLQQGQLLGQAEAIGLTGLQEVSRDLWVGEAMATAAIEGQLLDLEAVRSSVGRQLGLEEAGPRNHHIDGLVDVMRDAVEGYGEALDEDRLCRWHSALFPGGTSGVRRMAVGRYRDHEDPMQIVSGRPGREVVHYVAPPSSQVPAEMTRFLSWFNGSRPVPGAMGTPGAAGNGIARAAVAHLWFETIHPFEDGNGRLGRALVDMAIAQDVGSSTRLFSLSHQLLDARAAYHEALNSAQRGSLDVTAWVQWFTQAFAASCVNSRAVVKQAMAKAAFWQRAAIDGITPRQRKVLKRLIDAGDGGFLGGMTADKYCKLTGVSKATATRDLAQLLQLGLLIVEGVGKATHYAVNVEGWNATREASHSPSLR